VRRWSIASTVRVVLEQVQGDLVGKGLDIDRAATALCLQTFQKSYRCFLYVAACTEVVWDFQPVRGDSTLFCGHLVNVCGRESQHDGQGILNVLPAFGFPYRRDDHIARA